MRKVANPYPVGLNFGGAAAQRMSRQLHSVAEQNARRVPCPECDLRILPEQLARHIEIVHRE